MAKVAWIELGVMGYPMAGHIATKGGHELAVYNVTSTKAEAWGPISSAARRRQRPRKRRKERISSSLV